MKKQNNKHKSVFTLLILMILPLFLAVADVEKPKFTLQPSTVVLDVDPVCFHSRFPNIGVNVYFFDAFRAIRNAEAQYEENEKANALQEEMIMRSADRPALGLNGFLQNPSQVVEDVDGLHLSVK
jgi:hypothetical protein